MALTDVQCRKASSGDGIPRKLWDADGLHLQEGRYWRLDYRFDGKRKTLALGTYPQIRLVDARRACRDARLLVQSGVDPSAVRRETKRARKIAASNSFESVARAWWTQWSPTKTPRHAAYVLRRLQADVFPAIGSRPTAELRARDLIEVAKKVEDRGAIDIAKRALETMGQVLRYAVANDIIERNPATDIKPSDALKPRKKRNYARITERELPELLRAMDRYVGAEFTRLALLLMMLTFVRTSELIGARFQEFDTKKRQWRIPAERMKMRTEHIVPLSRQALAILDSLRELRRGRDPVFPNEIDHSKTMSNNTMLYAFYRMGYRSRMTGHGVRGVASTILHEQGWPHEHIELQLAHQPRNAVSAAYNHALYLPQRAKMMQAWADYLDRAQASGPGQ